MKRLMTTKLTVFLALLFVTQGGLGAQELNDSALKERFQRQIDLFKAARLGATRGLVLNNGNAAPNAHSSARPVSLVMRRSDSGSGSNRPAKDRP